MDDNTYKLVEELIKAREEATALRAQLDALHVMIDGEEEDRAEYEAKYTEAKIAPGAAIGSADIRRLFGWLPSETTMNIIKEHDERRQQ